MNNLETKNAPRALSLDSKLKSKIEKLHFQALGFQAKGFEKAVELGELLSRVKIGLPHGLFGRTIEREFPFLKMRTVQYYLKIYHNQDILRRELGANLSIVDARNYLTKKTGKGGKKPIPKSTKNAIDDHIRKEEEAAAEKIFRSYQKGKLGALPEPVKEILVNKRTTRLETLAKREERLFKALAKTREELEILKSESAPRAFLEVERTNK